jgi:hypothetical protein
MYRRCPRIIARLLAGRLASFDSDEQARYFLGTRAYYEASLLVQQRPRMLPLFP